MKKRRLNAGAMIRFALFSLLAFSRFTGQLFLQRLHLALFKEEGDLLPKDTYRYTTGDEHARHHLNQVAGRCRVEVGKGRTGEQQRDVYKRQGWSTPRWRRTARSAPFRAKLQE